MGAKKLISLAAIFIIKARKDMELWNDADRALGSKCEFKRADQMNYGHMLGPVSYEHNTKMGWTVALRKAFHTQNPNSL